jgi:hypothetical protein
VTVRSALTTFVLFAALLAGLGAQQSATPARDQQKPVKGTAVIKGFVVDAQSGAPLRRANVTAGGSEVGTRGTALSDAEGRFEITELRAGRYFVSATRTGYLPTTFGQTRFQGPGKPLEIAEGHTVEKVIVRMSRGGVISGKVFDEFGEPAAGARVSAHQYRFEGGMRRLSVAYSGTGMVQTDDLGAFRLYGLQPGQYYVSAQPMGGMLRPMGGDTAETTGPITSYFPNATDPASAQRVTVGVGRETGPINITLVNARLARIRGKALMSSGEPFAGSFVRLEVRDHNSSSSTSGGRVAADGTFELQGVSAGRYLIVVRPQNARDDDDVEVARTWLTVTGDDVDDVMLVGGRGAILRGTVVTDEGVPMPVRPHEIHLMMTAVGDDRGSFFRPPSLKDDYSFELKGLFGRYRLNAVITSGPTGPAPAAMTWGQKAVVWRGEDVSNKPFEFETGQVVDGVEIVFSRKWSELSGTVTDDRGAAVTDSWLVLFPADENEWTDVRYVRATRPGLKDVYRFQRLLPHDYLLATVPAVEPGQWQDPDFLRSVRDRAVRVSVGDGETKVQNLKVGSAPQ